MNNIFSFLSILGKLFGENFLAFMKMSKNEDKSVKLDEITQYAQNVIYPKALLHVWRIPNNQSNVIMWTSLKTSHKSCW